MYNCTYNNFVGFEWDEESKTGINFRKHGVRMPEAIPVLDDPHAITIADDESDPGEQRFVTIGMGTKGRFSSWSTRSAGTTSESSPRVLQNPMSASSMRQTMKDRYDFSKGKRGRIVHQSLSPKARYASRSGWTRTSWTVSSRWRNSLAYYRVSDLINAALREYLEGKSPRFEDTLRRIIREEIHAA